MRAFALGRLALWALFVAALSACSQTAVGTKTDSPASIIAAAPTVRASLAPGARTLSGQFFGYNLDYGTLKAWKTDQHLVSQTASMAAGTLRYPGGTVANY